MHNSLILLFCSKGPPGATQEGWSYDYPAACPQDRGEALWPCHAFHTVSLALSSDCSPAPVAPGPCIAVCIP